MYKNRYHFWSDYKNYLININNNFSSYDYFEKYYFNSQQGVEKFFNLIRDVFNYDGELKDLYKSFICDINWAKSSQFCQVKVTNVTNVNNTTNQQPTSGDFPDCVKNLKNFTNEKIPYYLGVALDANQNKYDVLYFNIPERSGNHPGWYLCKILDNIVLGRPITMIYTCPKQGEKYIQIAEIVDNGLAKKNKFFGYTEIKTMNENLNEILRNNLIETKNKKKKSLQETKIIDTRFKIIVESDNIKTKDDLNDTLIEILHEMVYLHNQGFDDKIIAESVENVFGVLNNIFKGSSNSILDTFKERGVKYIMNKLQLDGNGYLENFLITAIGNTSLSDVPKLFTDCNFLTKKIAESIPEAYLRKLEYETGMGNVFMDAVRNSLYDVIRNSDFANRIETSISGIICPIVDKMSDSFTKKLDNMKINLIGNTQA